MATFALRLPDDLYQQAKRQAQAEGKSINQLITEALAESLRLVHAHAAVAEMRKLQEAMPPSGDGVAILRQLREERSEPRG